MPRSRIQPSKKRLLPTRLVPLLIAVATLVSAASPVAAQPDPAVRIRTHGSPFDPDGEGDREVVRIELALAEAARVDLAIRDFDGRHIRHLARAAERAAGTHAWTWNGRDGRGRRVSYGAYRARAVVRLGSGPVLRRQAWVTRARRVPYPVRPGAIVVALDPGHGGPAAGAVWRRLREDDVNLDIGLRLEAMLRGAGIGVVMTRRRDRNVSPAGLDITGDRRYSRLDELVARNDIANQAGADIHVAIHNNGVGCHCLRGTSMYTHARRAWSPEGRALARHLLEQHLWHLRRVPAFRPRDLGVMFFPFKALKPYHPRHMPRPSLQPTVLGESLFIDSPPEHRILARRSGRTVIAAAYFDGIARFLDQRRYGLRYDVIEAPRSVPMGSTVNVRVRLTNRGHATSRDWRLVARVVRAVRRYDGRPRRGTVAAAVGLPDGLGPGESAEVVLERVPMPQAAGRWLIKLDVDLRGGDHMSGHGVVGPQLRVRTRS
jgi:N-acetylmuramoyl-L-alanine amidase